MTKKHAGTVLVTGGTGYLGSHTCVQLLDAGYRVLVLDNLSNSTDAVIPRIERLAGRSVDFHRIDLRNREAIITLLTATAVDAVIHFAGLKSVPESFREPDRYVSNNVDGTRNLLDAMELAGCRRIVFSSSATVYGDPRRMPVDERTPLAPTNPYGETKVASERLIESRCRKDERWRATILRYFNPVGAHPSGQLGESPTGVPGNLMPHVARVAARLQAELTIYGDDYPTVDGTGVRDYIHVEDLAAGHLAALDRLARQGGARAYNLGTGSGHSVLQLVATFEKACGRSIPCHFAPRRDGDVASSYATVQRARDELGWRPRRGLEQMCRDSWRWQQTAP